MKTHLVTPPDAFLAQFIRSLKKGRTLIPGIGTFYITTYRKKAHPSFTSTQEVTMKAKKISRINFKPHHKLKEVV